MSCPGEVYNMGGYRFSNCRMTEAIGLCKKNNDHKMHTNYTETNRIGDHIWRNNAGRKFAAHHSDCRLTKTVRDILAEIHEYNLSKWKTEG